MTVHMINVDRVPRICYRYEVVAEDGIVWVCRSYMTTVSVSELGMDQSLLQWHRFPIT